MIKDNRRFWKLLLFTIATLGIYNIVFWYQMTRDLNDMNREERKLPNYFVVILLSILTLGIYRWVWFFYLADRIQVTGRDLGVKISPGPGTTLALRLFGTFLLVGPFLSSYLVIRNMNRIATVYNRSIHNKTRVVA